MVFDVNGPWLENALTVNLTSDQTEPAPSVVPGPGAAQLDRHYCTASFFLFLFQESKPIHNCPVRSFLDIESHKQVRKKPESFACQHPAEGWGGRTPPQRRGLIAGSWINDRTVNLPATQIWLRSSSTRFLRFKKKKKSVSTAGGLTLTSWCELTGRRGKVDVGSLNIMNSISGVMNCETEWHHAAGSLAPLADYKWTPDEDARRIHHDSAAKHVTVTSSGKQPGARTSRTLKHFLCNILKLYRDTRQSSESLVVFSCF